MTAVQRARIANPLWLAGSFFARQPVPVTLTPTRHEAVTRIISLGSRLDRIFLREGQPNVLKSFDIGLPWPKELNDADLDKLDTLADCGRRVDLVVWKQVFQIFDGDNTRVDFYARRRQVVPLTPNDSFSGTTIVPPRWTGFGLSTSVTVFDRPITSPGASVVYDYSIANGKLIPTASASMDSTTPAADEVAVENEGHSFDAIWWTRLKFGTAPPAQKACIRVAFVPIFSVLIQTESPMTYPEGNAENRGYVFTEAA